LHRVKRYWLALKGYRIFGKKVAVFGDFTVIHPQKVWIGRNCAINHDVFILGRSGVKIGDDVVLSARCMIIDASLDPANFASTAERRYIEAPILIGDGSWIGAGAIILPGVSIGEKCIIGAGAVVTRDVAAGSILAGNPGRVIGKCGEG